MGECAGLQRADVDPLGSRVHVRRQVQRDRDQGLLIRDPKAQSRRSVTLPRQVMDLMEAHMAAHTGTEPDAWVFTRPHGNPVEHNYVGKLWRRALASAAAEDPTMPKGLRFHDLRGTGATLATAQGATLREVMDRLGHNTMVAAMRYQHAASDRADTIAQLLGQAIDQAAGGSVARLDDRR